MVVENVNSPATAVEVCGTNQNNATCHRRDLRSTWMGSCDQWLVVEGDRFVRYTNAGTIYTFNVPINQSSNWVGLPI